MKRIKCVLLLIEALLILVSCDNTGNKGDFVDCEVKQIRFDKVKETTYPMLIYLNLTDSESEDSQVFELKENWGSYLLNGEDTDVKALINNSYSYNFVDGNALPSLLLKHSYTLSKKGRRFSAERTSVTIFSQVLPIQLLSPRAEDPAYMPLVYYNNLKLTWNPDETNNNGIIVFVEWNGLVYDDGDDSEIPIRRAILVPDIGETTLSGDIFDGIPNYASVSLYLIRANIVEVTQEGMEMPFEDVEWCELIDAYPEIVEQTYIVVMGNATRFAFALIRELN